MTENVNINMDRLVAELRKRGAEGAQVFHSGGGCQTISVPPTHPEDGYGERHAMLLGPGNWSTEGPFGYAGEFCYGPDDDGADHAACRTVETFTGDYERLADDVMAHLVGLEAARYAAFALEGIGEDIAAGRVPASVTAFSQLHDYVDANDYLPQMGGGVSFEVEMQIVNAATDLVTDELRKRALEALGQPGLVTSLAALVYGWIKGVRA